jgi:hypothetical protein
LLSLLKEPPLEVLLADPILTSMGEISYWMEGRLEPPMSGSIFLGSSSLKDFFLVCWVMIVLRRIGDWSPVQVWVFVYYWPGCF